MIGPSIWWSETISFPRILVILCLRNQAFLTVVCTSGGVSSCNARQIQMPNASCQNNVSRSVKSLLLSHTAKQLLFTSFSSFLVYELLPGLPLYYCWILALLGTVMLNKLGNEWMDKKVLFINIYYFVIQNIIEYSRLGYKWPFRGAFKKKTA